MLARTYCLFLVVAIKSVHSDRNIVASPELCATYPNEEFDIDLKRCQNTCGEYGRTWDCSSYKPYGDCYCKAGFARIVEDGKCVSVIKHAKCAQKLPIAAESCVGDNEYHTEEIDMGRCDASTCFTYMCANLNPYRGPKVKWGPHCECSFSYLRLTNGTCARNNDPSCVAEYQPSLERCASIGQIFTEEGHCQAGFNDENYCPPKGPACICPANKIARLVQNFRLPPEHHSGTTAAPEDFPINMIEEHLLGCYTEAHTQLFF